MLEWSAKGEILITPFSAPLVPDWWLSQEIVTSL